MPQSIVFSILVAENPSSFPDRNLRFYNILTIILQKGNAPVFLKGATDVLIYRGAMALSVVGLTVSFYGVYLMAMGKMKKARN